MQPVISVEEMRAADAAAPEPTEVLVERAGAAAARAALGMLGGTYGRRVVLVAGKGNNGADGRAAGALLARRGVRVEVVEAAAATGTRLAPSDLVLDAAYGTGFRGSYAPPDPGSAPVLALDIPSGINGDTGEAGPDGAVHATATVTFAALKPGLLLGDGPSQAGTVTVADIGLAVGEPATNLIEDADAGRLIPPRRRDAHKWDSAVWVVAGSPGMQGAAALCGRAAYRAGAGMVRVGSPGVDAGAHAPSEAVARSLPPKGWEQAVLAEAKRVGAVVVGPGLGVDQAPSVRALIEGAPTCVVVDADGLNALAGPGNLAAAVRSRPSGSPSVVVTPHDGEFARLAGHPPGADRLSAARDLARASGAVVLLKGPTTVVAHPDGRALLATAGGARLATAGTGDVLAGMIGALVAQGVVAFEAAALAAHVHGRAAALGPDHGLVAGDLPELVARWLSLRAGP